jgi:hypothetical protein
MGGRECAGGREWARRQQHAARSTMQRAHGHVDAAGGRGRGCKRGEYTGADANTQAGLRMGISTPKNPTQVNWCLRCVGGKIGNWVHIIGARSVMDC